MALTGDCHASPTTGDLVLLADPGLVAEPDLYVTGIEATLACDRRQPCRPILWDGPPLLEHR
jgi:hypothetical protein